MPVIDVTYPSGSLSPDAQAAVAKQLTDIVMDIEGTKGISAIAAGTWLVLHEANPGTIAVGGEFAPARYRVDISTPEGTLNMSQKEALIGRVTDALLDIEGAEVNDNQRARVYCLIHEVSDGGWGFSGIAITKAFTATRLQALKSAQQSGHNH